MTPLAASIAKQLLLPPAERTFKDDANVFPLMGDIHCFEVSEITELATGLLAPLRCWDGKSNKPISSFNEMAKRVSFCPAERTWIEFKVGNSGDRTAYFILSEPKSTHASLVIIQLRNGEIASFSSILEIGMGAFGGFPMMVKAHRPEDRFLEKENYVMDMILYVQAFLALINTPKIIGRVQHTANAGLAKKFRRSGAHFPLNAWHEIKLNVSKPTEIDDGVPHEAHLTGTRALHFCRAHLRIRNGAVEFVTHHWRGNPTLGKKNTKYRMVSEPA
jgi:hypothetical protein